MVTNLTGTPSVTTTSNPFSCVGGLIALLVFFLYFTLLRAAYGQTVGEMDVTVKIVQRTGRRSITRTQQCATSCESSILFRFIQ
jgi:uncharacterized RDD family membrane protein YckC